MALDHPMIPLPLLEAGWIDEASNLSRLDPSGADQSDPEHPARKPKVEETCPA
jgi:hypothetical protein